MKKALFLVFAFLASATMAWAQFNSIQIDGLYYKLNHHSHTASVDYGNYNGRVVIPEKVQYNGVTYTVTKLEDNAFAGSENLTAVTIPNTIKNIESIFWGCPYLRYINVSKNHPTCTSVDGVLYDKKKKRLIAIPNGYTGDFAIPKGVERISTNAFFGCDKLECVKIPATVTGIDTWGIFQCNKAFEVDRKNKYFQSIDGVLFDKSNTLLSFPCKREGDYTIPDFVQTIVRFAFHGRQITSLTISENVETIEWDAFGGTSAIQRYIVVPANQKYSSVDGILLSKDKKTLVAYPSGEGRDYTIPSYVQIIGTRAFAGNQHMKRITIPDNVQVIEPSAFSSCAQLQSVTIGNSVKTIHRYAFSSCKQLETVIFGENVQTIEDNAFNGCKNMRVIKNMSLHPQMLGNYVFTDCSHLTVYTDKKVLDSYTQEEKKKWSPALLKPSNETGICGSSIQWTLNLLDSTLTISGSGAMDNWSEDSPAPWNSDWRNIRRVTISSGVTMIGDYAFYNCKYLSHVTLPPTIIYIGSSSFGYCPLSAIDFPSRLQKIGSYACYQTRLKQLYIPEKVSSIGSAAFGNCSFLDSIAVDPKNKNFCVYNSALMSKDTTRLLFCPNKWGGYIIPEQVKSIDVEAFRHCSHLKTIMIPRNVAVIGEGAFANCYNLETIYNQAPRPQKISEQVFRSVNKNKCVLYAFPEKNEDAFTSDAEWGKFRQPVKEGQCNAAIRWSFSSSTKTLTVSGTGDMPDWKEPTDVPWKDYMPFMVHVEVTEAITRIGNNAFAWSQQLATVRLPESLKTIGERAFYSCTTITEISIPKNVTTIEDGAFINCAALRSLHIPASVTKIGLSDFLWCKQIRMLTVAENNPNYCAVDGILYTKDRTRLLLCPAAMPITEYTIPATVTEIDMYALYGCKNIKTLIIPSHKINIGYAAFAETNFAHVYSYATVPPEIMKFYSAEEPTLYSAFFNASVATSVLHVPAKSVDAYKATAGWNEFGSIQPIE